MSKKQETLLQQILEKLNDIADNQKNIINIIKEKKIKVLDAECLDNTRVSLKNLVNITEWNSIIKKRKLAYYKKIRNEGIKEYEKNVKESPPKISRKLKENSYPGQSENQTERMKKLEITKLELEIERLED